jgi:hypothetical protein
MMCEVPFAMQIHHQILPSACWIDPKMRKLAEIRKKEKLSALVHVLLLKSKP